MNHLSLCPRQTLPSKYTLYLKYRVFTHIKLSRQSKLGRGVEQLDEHIGRTVEHHTTLALDALPHDAKVVALLVFADSNHIVVHLAQLQQILQASRGPG